LLCFNTQILHAYGLGGKEYLIAARDCGSLASILFQGAAAAPGEVGLGGLQAPDPEQHHHPPQSSVAPIPPLAPHSQRSRVTSILRQPVA